MNKIVFILCFFILGSKGNVDFPAPPDIKYPPDFCDQVKNGEAWDFVVVGGGKLVTFMTNSSSSRYLGRYLNFREVKNDVNRRSRSCFKVKSMGTFD